LEVSKCSFHLIQSKWTTDGNPFLDSSTNKIPLCIQSQSGRIQVSQLSNYQSHKTLGHYINPSGSMISQVQQLIRQGHKFATMVKTNILTPEETRLFYHAIYLPSITYTLGNSHLTPQECHKIETPIHQAVLPRCGYHRTMALAVRYGPPQYGGAGFRDLYTEQTVTTILNALKHLQNPSSQIGQMLRIALSWAQAYVGTSTFLWEDTTSDLPSCPSNWIIGIRNALKHIDGTISLKEKMTEPILRTNDSHIMDKAIQLRHVFCDRDIDKINACRRYLQATTLADISNDQGTKIEPVMFNGSYQATPVTHQCELFNQGKPGPRSWRVWKKFIKQLTTGHLTLHVPLKEWIVDHSQCRKRPQYIYSEAPPALYQFSHSGYVRTERKGPGRYEPSYSYSDVTPAISGFPVHVCKSGRDLIPWHNYIPPASPPSPPQDFQQHVSKHEDWERQLLATYELSGSPQEIIHILNQQGTISAASDGTVHDTSAAYGYVIASTSTKQRLINGKGPAFGSNPSSFRAEAYGALALLRMLLQIQHFTGTRIQQPVHHYIDNSSVVHRIKIARKNT
jgi:hypothetical protein